MNRIDGASADTQIPGRRSQTARPVENINGDLNSLVDSMAQTMYAASGVGLAAPHVGESKRTIVLDTDHKEPDKHLLKLINPRVVEADGKIIWKEGCLSVIDYSRGGGNTPPRYWSGRPYTWTSTSVT